MTATMYDSTTPKEIPASAKMVAGYVNGRYAWKPADWARFPDAVKLQITVDPHQNVGDIYDCEPGNRSADANVWPRQCVNWVDQRLASGHPFPVIYCDYNDIVIIQQVCAGMNVGYWVADPHTTAGTRHPSAIAVQYAWPNDPDAEGRNVDVSTVYGGPWLASFDAIATLSEAVSSENVEALFPGTVSYGVGMYPAAASIAVKAFQTRLNAHGFNCGAVDGRDGPETTEALKRFQSSVEIVVDGIGGPITWEHLA